jgi:tetratricopeptide (TPR) repeat protein
MNGSRPLYRIKILCMAMMGGALSAALLAQPTDTPSLKDRSQVVWDFLNANNLGKAAEAMDQFLRDNPTPQVVPLARDLGWGFSSKFRDFGKAMGIYQYLIDKYPDDPQIVFVFGSRAKALIDQEKPDEAMAAVEPLFGDKYAVFEKQFEVVAWLAWEFQQIARYDTAADLFRRLIKAYPDDPRSCKARADLLWTLLQSGPPGPAKALINEIFSKCSDPAIIKPVEDCIWIVRQTYKDYPKALEMYFRLLNRFPNAPNIVQVRRCIVETYIEMGARDIALTEAADFERDFAGNPQQMWAFAVGVAAGIRLEDEAVRTKAMEQFVQLTANPEFAAAFQYIQEQYMDRISKGPRPPAPQDCRIPIEIYEQVMAAAPTLDPTLQTLGFVAMCYQWSGRPDKATALYNKAVLREPKVAQSNSKTEIAFAGDRFCGAYCVWHLLRHYGTTVPVEEIIDQMSIRKKGFSTVQDIVDILAARNIPAQPMNVAADKLAKLDTPFIQYRIPMAGSDLGHFVLCIPTGDGKAVVLDGAKDPVSIDLAAISDKDAFWDGTIILIQRSRSDFLSQVITERMNWKTVLAMAECWYAADNPGGCMAQTQSYYASVAVQKLASLKAGCTFKTDCILNATTCNANLPCVGNTQCNPRWVCADQMLGERCMVVFSIWPDWPCVTDPVYPCTGMVLYTGLCIGGNCAISMINGYQICGTSVGQCHY